MNSVVFSAANMYGYSKNLINAYNLVMQPLCDKLDMPQTALDILLFLANNPSCDTAKDICEYRHLKPAIVSFYIEKLVGEEYLERQSVKNDRRKCKLICTKKCDRIITQGRHYQNKFASKIAEGLSKEDMEIFKKCLEVFESNLKAIKKDRI